MAVMAYVGDGLFILEPNSLAFGFVCSPLTGGDEQLMNRFKALLNLTWPTGTMLQFCLWAGPDIAAERIILPGTDELPEVFKKIRANRMEFLRQGSEAPMDRSGLMLRDIILVVTVRLPMNDWEPSDKEKKTARELQNASLETLKTCGLLPRILVPEDYIRVMETILNWSEDAVWRHSPAAQYDPARLIRKQVLDYDTSVKIFEDHLELGDKFIKILSPRYFPTMAYFGTSQHFMIDPLTGNRGIWENALITVNVFYPDTEAERPKLERGRAFATHQMHGPMSKFSTQLVKKKDSYDILFESMDEGNRVIQWMISLIIFTSREDAPGATNNAKSFWRDTGLISLEEPFINLTLFLNCLPFGAEQEQIKFLERYKKMATEHVLPFLPVFAGWQGTGTPVMQLVGRDGQLCFFDLFDSSTNFNAVITAQSGSGKSFFTNEMISQYLAVGARCWVIDIGRSYEKLAQSYGQPFISFNSDSPICLNPFSIVHNYGEEADILLDLVSTMATPNPKEELTNHQRSGLQETLKMVWENEGPKMTVDSLAEALNKDRDEDVKRVGRQLFAFTSRGIYGRFFNAENNVNFQGDMITIELEELRGKKQLQQVVLLQLIYQIQHEMFLGDRDRRKLVIVDEAWDLLTHGNIGKFIENGYRRFRKYGGAAVVITQSLNDLYASPSGHAIAENSAFKILLGQNSETITNMQKEGRLNVGEYGVELLKTLHTIPGKFSELCIVTEQGFGVERLYVEPAQRYRFSTKAEDVYALDQWQKKGLSVEEAIDRLVAAEQGEAA